MKNILGLLVFTLLLSFCGTTGRPPDPGTPWPAPLEGLFVSGDDSLLFAGEGRIVHWHFTVAPAPLEAQGEGIGIFLFQHKEYRYDAAETLRLMDALGREHSFLLRGGASAHQMTLFDENWTEGKLFINVTQP